MKFMRDKFHGILDKVLICMYKFYLSILFILNNLENARWRYP